MSATLLPPDEPRTAQPRRPKYTQGLITASALLSVAHLGPADLYWIETATASASPEGRSDWVAHHTARSAQERIDELKAMSGLTWDQLARAFGTTRRSLLHWHAGGSISAANSEKLTELLAELRAAGVAEAEAGRTWLMQVDETGSSPWLRWVDSAKRDDERRSWVSRQPEPVQET